MHVSGKVTGFDPSRTSVTYFKPEEPLMRMGCPVISASSTVFSTDGAGETRVMSGIKIIVDKYIRDNKEIKIRVEATRKRGSNIGVAADTCAPQPKLC